MIYGEIEGLSTPLPRMIFGTLALTEADAKTFRLLDSITEMGCCCLDTARAYADGASERVIGRWMHDRNNRSEVIVLGKGGHPVHGANRVNPQSIRQDLAQSLHWLKTGYIDLYLLHRDDPAVPVGPIVEVLNSLKNDGKIRLFGASNWNHTRLQQANEYADRKGLSTFSVASNQFSLAVQYDDPYPGTLSINTPADDGERRWYEQTQYPLLAWSSLARGFFSGKFTPDNLTRFTDSQSRISIRCYARQDNFARLSRARELAKKRGVTVPQIALAYVFQQPFNCFAITGASNTAEFKENIESLEINLTEEEIRWLDLKYDCLA